MGTRKPGMAAVQLVRLIEHCQREISGCRPARCRYRPTCSEYMKAAVLSFGAVRGVWYGPCAWAPAAPGHGGPPMTHPLGARLPAKAA